MDWLRSPMRLAIGVLTIGWGVTIAGCATTVMEKPGAAAGEFEHDKYDCELKLGYVGHAGGNQPTDQLADYLVRGKSETTRCMKILNRHC